MLVLDGPAALLDARRAAVVARGLRLLESMTRARAGVGLAAELLAVVLELEAAAGLAPVPHASRSCAGVSEPLASPPPAARSPHDLLDTAAVAGRLDCGPANVRDLRARGVLPATRVGGRWLFSEPDVVAELERRALRGFDPTHTEET